MGIAAEFIRTIVQFLELTGLSSLSRASANSKKNHLRAQQVLLIQCQKKQQQRRRWQSLRQPPRLLHSPRVCFLSIFAHGAAKIVGKEIVENMSCLNLLKVFRGPLICAHYCKVECRERLFGGGHARLWECWCLHCSS